MATYYVYITDQCKQDAVKHSVLKDIERLAEKIEIDQSDRGLDRFPPPYFKKSMGKPGRLIIEEYRKDNDIVLSFARYFIRGSSDYDSFYKNTESYYERNKVPKQDITNFLDERKQKPIQAKAELSALESTFLQSASTHHYTDDGAYLESYDWFERISQQWAKDYLSRYYDLLEEIESNIEIKEKDLLAHPKNSKIKILFRHFQQQNRTFLIAPIDPDNQDDEKLLREKYEHVLTAEAIETEELIRVSRRAYPTIITYDEDLWLLVQNSKEANLALSPEEEDILESVMKPSTDEPKYPLFINGRPGSGKSTILQYLFADQLTRFFELTDDETFDSPPLYLTYSTPLLEQARAAIENILSCGAANIEKGHNSKPKSEIDQILRSSFRNFREFLRSLLPRDRQNHFPHANYIDFDRFKKLWEKKRHQHPVLDVRKIGSELAWHAIRTFIKGMQHESGSVIDPEYYSMELPRDTKTISDQVFKTIFEQVWENWYEPVCNDDGFWDDQDLARAVLSNNEINLSQYPAIFCDEAQDFTTIELELIERLSIYSEREIPGYLVKQVPFAFAGDPFQTLNPTGFNWNALQSSFHDNIVQQLDPSGVAKLEFNFQELAFNYRSSEHIVKLANLVQLLRAVLLRIKGLKPQNSWTRKTTVSPVWYRRDDASCQSAIRNQDELVIIIPCQENGEMEYVEGDDFLKSVAIRDGQIARNVLSPARAKGLEYDRVLLYGFGDEVVSRLPELIEHISNPQKDPPEIESRLSWEYFLNQFYVAVSRSRKRLFIVDSETSLSGFWGFADTNIQKLLLELYQSGNDWEIDDIGGMVQGDNTSWDDDRDDPLELAIQWQNQGRAQRDPYLLRLAKDNFERSNRPEDAKLCEAEHLEFEGDFDSAARLFAQLRQAANATRCYWANTDSKSVIALAKDHPEITADPRFVAASCIQREQNSAAQIENVLNTLANVEPSPFPDQPGEVDAWRWFFSEFIRKFADAIEQSSHSASDWVRFIRRLEETIKRLELPLDNYPEFGKLFYLVGEPGKALAFWNTYSSNRKLDSKTEHWVIRAQAETEPYPANIKAYFELEEYKAALNCWDAVGRGVDEYLPAIPLLKSATKLHDLESVRKLIPVCNDLSLLHATLSEFKHDLGSLIGAIPVGIAFALEKQGEWGQLIHFVNNQTTSNKQLNALLKDAEISWDRCELVASLVRVFARSDRLAAGGSKSQKEVSEFLRNNLVIMKDAKKEKQQKVKSVHELVGIDEIGSAFERAYRLTYALEYYEQLFVKGYLSQRVLAPTSVDIDFARRRWILCKRRLAQTQEGANREKHEDEARKVAKELGVSIDQEPEYPELESIHELGLPNLVPPEAGSKVTDVEEEAQETVEPENNDEEQTAETLDQANVDQGQAIKRVEPHKISISSKITIDGLALTVEVMTRKRRVILTSDDTEDQVTCGPVKVSSNDLEILAVDTKDKKSIWACEAWGMLCELEDRDPVSIVRFRMADNSPIIGFEFTKD